MKTRQIIILGVFIIALAGIAFMLMSGMDKKDDDKDEKKEGTKNENKYVKVQTLRLDTIDITISSSGRIENVLSINLSAQASGNIRRGEVALKAGQSFKKGQVIFRLDKSQEVFGLKAMKSSFLNLMAKSLVDIKTDFPDRYIKWEAFFNAIDYTQVLPEIPEIKSTREKTFIATRNIYSEYFKIKSEEARLAKYTVYAPFSGTIKSVMQNIGSNVSPGMAVAQIAENANLELILPILLENKNSIKRGQKVKVLTDGNNITGMVKRISDIMDANTQSINVYVSLPKKGAELYEGMFVDARIIIGTTANVCKVSDRSVVNNDFAYFVEDSTLVLRAINILTKDKNKVILKVFEANTQIVVEPIPGAIEGMKVNPIQE